MTSAAGQCSRVIAWISAHGVHEMRQGPIRVTVASCAVELAVHMGDRHPQRNGIVVAAHTTAGQSRVIDLCGLPSERAVAGVALRAGHYVI